MVSRRNLLLGSVGLAGLAAVSRPGDRGGTYSDYFSKMNSVLRNNGIGSPVLVIDLDILDRNIDRVSQSTYSAPTKNYRVVTKSIPSPKLVEYVSARAKTNSQMIFHRPFLQAMTEYNPKTDVLIGKPMPIAAAAQFYAEHKSAFNPEHQLQWLIDSHTRLQQYLNFAVKQNLKLKVNLELDVGLHRGGFEADSGLASALALIQNNPAHLEFSGFMGYDAHLMGIPQFLVDGELAKAKQRYRKCRELLQEEFSQLVNDSLCFNGAGSPTFRHYEGDDLLTEVSVGSALMMPTHYDLPILSDFEAACFIASPVLKRLPSVRLPAFEWSETLVKAWDQNQSQMYFCYSGNWLAEVESPAGLSPHFAYVSSNQSGYSASPSVDIGVDDFIFLRPTQSEAVLLQFGDLVMMRGNKIVDRWPVIPATTS
jgi:D-serine deaminase-like pyridoxal phosphate-dependent protein